MKQRGLGEWLEQTVNRAAGEHTIPYSLIRLRSDEHDGYRLLSARQFGLQIRTAHPRHREVENEAVGTFDSRRSQEFFRRRERLGVEAQLTKKIRQGLSDRFVVVDADHQWPAYQLTLVLVPPCT